MAPKLDPKIVKKVDFWVFQKAQEVGRFLSRKMPKTVKKRPFFSRLRRDFFNKNKNPALNPPARAILKINFPHRLDQKGSKMADFGQKQVILAQNDPKRADFDQNRPVFNGKPPKNRKNVKKR